MSASSTRSTTSALVTLKRRWASGRELDLIEQIALAYQPYQIATPFLRVLPLALDTSALVNLVAYVARRGRSGLLDATDMGLIRLYVGESIPVEVERNLAKRAISTHRPASELVAAWRDQVRPRLRVMDTRGLKSDGLALIVERHDVDRPTATLSLVLGVRLTWSEDPDLVDLRYAENLRVDVLVRGAGAVGSFDLTAHLALSLSSDADERRSSLGRRREPRARSPRRVRPRSIRLAARCVVSRTAAPSPGSSLSSSTSARCRRGRRRRA